MFEGIGDVLYNAVIVLADNWDYHINSRKFIEVLNEELGINYDEYLELMGIEENDLIDDEIRY